MKASTDFVMFRDMHGFREWLIKLYKECKKGDTDGLIVICGKERIGKTELALRIKYGLNPTLCLDEKGRGKVSNVHMDGVHYRMGIRDTEAPEIIIFDEAGSGLFSRDAMSQENKKIIKKLMVCGYKNLLHILCLPDFLVLDRQVRRQRVKALIRVTNRSKFVVYKRKKIKKINMNNSYDGIRTSSKGSWVHFNIDEGFKIFEKAYREKEKKYKDKQMAEEDLHDKDIQENDSVLPKERLYDISEIAGRLGLTNGGIRKWIREGRVKAYKIGLKWKLPESEVKKIVPAI